MKRDEKLWKEMKALNFEPLQLMFMIFDLAFNVKSFESSRIVYSKQFFTHYYCIDAHTFEKWIIIFCPDLFPTYKKKRIFNSEEVEYIFKNLGSLPHSLESLVDRKEVMNKIYKDKNWKNSRLYKEFSLQLEEKLPDVKIKLNKLPPKILLGIIKDEIEELSKIADTERDINYENRIKAIYDLISKYRNMTTQDWEIRKRWFRRFMNGND
jgi:hypothetical protein